ncbi:MAG: hypothetical protein JO093_17020 [Acidobacteria bacterium]|nr:hypothetical protein [Acidobacteriota bacterium]MBV9068800.1 hypothetical protein [Acidobacteriota bacterium]MBV9187320.1 hypothetical protein [Acidobacteriota bacterium]
MAASLIDVAARAASFAFREYFSPFTEIIQRRRRAQGQRIRVIRLGEQTFLAQLFTYLAIVARIRLDHLTEAEFDPLLAYLRALDSGLRAVPSPQLEIWEGFQAATEDCSHRVCQLIEVLDTAASRHLDNRPPYQDAFRRLALAVAADIDDYYIFAPPQIKVPPAEIVANFALALQRATNLVLPVETDDADAATPAGMLIG